MHSFRKAIAPLASPRQRNRESDDNFGRMTEIYSRNPVLSLWFLILLGDRYAYFQEGDRAFITTIDTFPDRKREKSLSPTVYLMLQLIL